MINENNENQRIGYYAVIPATVLFNENLKANEKLLYAIITALSNKEGYCYASNKYLAGKFNVDPKTISSWLSDLRKYNHIVVEILRNEKQEIIQRKIYPNDVPYTLNNGYPSPVNYREGIHQNIEDNNIINNNINTHIVSKQKYAERVYLYDYEYKSLIEKYGTTKANKCIEELNLYKKSKGVEYASDFDTIKRWVIIRVEENEARINRTKVRKTNKKVQSYEQREYPKEFFDTLYANEGFLTEKAPMQTEDESFDCEI